MTKDAVAVLEIGSQKVTCIIGQRGVNGTFLIKSLAECDYEGFCDARFFDEPSLAYAVREVINKTSKTARTDLNKLFISVPGEFTYATTRHSSLAFRSKKRIKKRDLEEMHDKIGTDDRFGYTITDYHPMYYTLDDNRVVYNPEGTRSYKVTGLFSYIYTSKAYIRLLTNICKPIGVTNLEFISETLAESKYLITNEEKELKKIVIDVGYLTTNVYVTYANGVLYQKAFSYGGGYITADLIRIIETDRPIDMALKFEIEERLKRKINLGYDMNAEGHYQLVINDEDFFIRLQKANVTVKKCLDNLAGMIDEVMRNCPLDLQISAPVALTGGGVSYIRGAKEYLSSRLEMPIHVIAPQIPYMNKAEESACLSLLNEALNRNRK